MLFLVNFIPTQLLSFPVDIQQLALLEVFQEFVSVSLLAAALAEPQPPICALVPLILNAAPKNLAQLLPVRELVWQLQHALANQFLVIALDLPIFSAA